MDDIIEKITVDYSHLIDEIEELKSERISKLKAKYIKKSPFGRGDLIYNVTGIIRITSIDFEIEYNGRGELLPISVIYNGIKYKWIKGGFVSPTKRKEMGSLRWYTGCSIKKIDKNKIME
jgi:hypothetical protein